jgi:hypothetical protein
MRSGVQRSRDGLDLGAFADAGLTPGLVRTLLGEHDASLRPTYERLWSYYRNEVRLPGCGSGDHGAAQECGLPRRLRGGGIGGGAGHGDGDARDREVVIENDIRWRVDAMVDFVFGKPITIVSTAEDERLRERIELALDAAWEASGGVQLLQDACTLGIVFGFVDFVVRWDGLWSAPAELRAAASEDSAAGDAALAELASRIRIEPVPAVRAVPVVNPSDYRVLDAYMVRSERVLNEVGGSSFGGGPRGLRSVGERVAQTFGLSLHGGSGGRGFGGGSRRVVEAIEVHTAQKRGLFVDGELVELVDNPLGVVPVVHVQNASQPLRYAGLSEVESLIPLQDELNTRLSDRAHRVTMQSFRMYLAKGIDGLDGAEAPRIGPGQVWSTDNPDASIEAFGGDRDSPSESDHVEQVREALDKASGVSPLVLGLIRARLGQLSSENALRITLMGVLSKMERKRRSYGGGVLRVSELVLAALDAAGGLRTSASDRGAVIQWQDPLPLDENRRLAAARAKVDLGVPRERVLAELGYAATDPGVQ